MKHGLRKILSIALVASMLAGCSFGGKSNEGDKTPATLKVMYYDEGSFFQEYGMLFSALYPEIDIQVVSTQSINRGGGEDGEEVDYEQLKKDFIETEQPDILMLDMSEVETMAGEGMLADLETYVAKDNFDTEGLVPGMIDYMKELGGGQLYGLPSGFNSQVLFYNKALFDKYNIAYPTDQMTWSEIIGIARQFPTEGEPEDRVYGMKAGYSGDLNELATLIATAEGLNYVNPSTKQMTINTPGWKNAIQTAYDAIKSETLYSEGMDMGGNSSYEDYLLRNPFISGRLAMTMDGSYFIQQMKEAADYFSKDEGKVVKDWDIVTIPVSAQYPDQSASTWFNNIFAIAKDSPNADAAWKFISYISGEEFARVKSKSSYGYGNFSIHTKYIKDDEGRNFAAFYKLKPSKQQMDYKEYEKLPTQFNMMFYNYMNEEFRAIQEGTKSIDEALELLQVKGEELLAQESMTDEEINEYWQKEMEKEQQEMQPGVIIMD